MCENCLEKAKTIPQETKDILQNSAKEFKKVLVEFRSKLTPEQLKAFTSIKNKDTSLPDPLDDKFDLMMMATYLTAYLLGECRYQDYTITLLNGLSVSAMNYGHVLAYEEMHKNTQEGATHVQNSQYQN